MRLPDFAESAALLVGVADYPGGVGFGPVPNALRNLDGLSRLLSPGSERGFPKERLHLLSNPEAGDAIRASLERVSRQARDVLFFYYVGHGWKVEDELHLASTASTPGSIETTGIRYETVRRILRASPAAIRIVILDCCFSGSAATGLLGGDTTLRLTERELRICLPDGAEGVCVISSSGPDEPSRDSDDRGYTAFTGHFLRALEAGRDAGGQDLEAAFRATKVRMSSARLDHTPLISVEGEAHRVLLIDAEPRAGDAAPALQAPPEPTPWMIKWDGPWGKFEFPDLESAESIMRLLTESRWLNRGSDHDSN